MYKSMRTIFHEGNIDVEGELSKRHNLSYTTILPFSFSDEKLFFTLTDDIYEMLLAVNTLDKKILKFSYSLPKKAVQYYCENILIDEIILTNKIEGVNSSRKEINDALESLKNKSGKIRFQDMVKKYQKLSDGCKFILEDARDVRSLYSELVYDEVLKENPKNAIDGKLFRKNKVDVCDSSGKSIHTGICPENKIVEYLNQSLDFLNNAQVNTIVKAAVFHYLFGYIHPFYDGNGRINRYISSNILTNELSSLVALRLSYSIQKNLNRYYSSFSKCQHPLNREDLTPFLYSFCKFVVEAAKDVCDTLSELKIKYDNSCALINERLKDCNPKTQEIAKSLLISTIFSAYGSTPSQLAEEFEITRQTVYARVDKLKELGLISQKQKSYKTYYTISFNAL